MNKKTMVATAPGKVNGGRKIRRLFVDIESSPNIVSSWRIGHKINLSYDNIIKERAIIVVCYKWEGESEVHSLHWDSQQDDKQLLIELVDVLNEADEVIGHNAARFDVPWIRTRCLFHRTDLINPELKVIDTLQWARRTFYFNSNRLDYLGKFLGVGGKLKTEFGLWKAVLSNDKKALLNMIKYCKQDVLLLEKVWKLLSNMVKPKTHVGVIQGCDKWTCPRTGSDRVKVSKTRVSATGAVSYQMVNLETGGYYTIGKAAHEAYLEAKKKAVKA